MLNQTHYYSVPIEYTAIGWVGIEATSAEEAYNIAVKSQGEDLEVLDEEMKDNSWKVFKNEISRLDT